MALRLLRPWRGDAQERRRYSFVPDYSGKPFTLFTHGGMLMDLQELLGREVDLVVEGSHRPYAAETANRDKILIYEKGNG